MAAEIKKEKDILGEVEVPSNALYGGFTQRAKHNFQISGLRINPVFIKSLAAVKKASALANMRLGNLDKQIGKAIVEACDEILHGAHLEQFGLDIFQAGAGTSYNMNANEVIANLASKKLQGKQNAAVHPNNHVNMAQSTNDVIPTVIRLSSLMLLKYLIIEINKLGNEFKNKAKEHNDVLKVGRTHLMDAVPITYGEVFNGYSTALSKSVGLIEHTYKPLFEICLGGTAVGTGITVSPKYRKIVAEELTHITDLNVYPAEDNIEVTWNMGVFSVLSHSLREYAVVLDKIANDMRLLSSGPKTGFAELLLPGVQPGSSIMPGKINPSIAEAVNMVCYQVMGNDCVISKANEKAELELNVMTPVIAYNILWSIEILTTATKVFREKCVAGLKVDKEKCGEYMQKSLSIATALNPYLGYEVVSEIVNTALKEKKTIKDVILDNKLVDEKTLSKLLDMQHTSKPCEVDKSLSNKIKSTAEFKKFLENIKK